MLRNQGIVIVLALIAVLLVGKNLVWPFLKPKFARRAPPATAPATQPVTPQPVTPQPATAQAAASPGKPGVSVGVPPASGPSNSAQRTQPASPRADQLTVPSMAQKNAPGDTATTAVPEDSMNVQQLWNSGAAWTASPLRDPFKMRGAVNDKSAREQLTLTGILRQTQSDLAVLNNRVLAVGDSILGFRLETIEPDRVWVSGPNGREMLEFRYSPAIPLASSETVPPIASAGAQGGQ